MLLYSKLPPSPPPPPPSTPPELAPKWGTSAISISHHPCLLLLERCRDMRTLKTIHAHMIRHHLSSLTFPISRVVAFCAISPYGSIEYARLVFSQIQNPNTFITNTIIRGYAGSAAPELALEFFRETQESGAGFDHHTFTFLIKACARLGSLPRGREIHGRAMIAGLGGDGFIQNALIHMYSSSGDYAAAQKIFVEMPQRDLVCWNTMINCCVQTQDYIQALDMFERMVVSGVEPDEVTMVTLLTACAQAGNLETGRRLHSWIIESKLKLGVVLQTALVDMYAKCGCLKISRQVFDEMPERNLVTWNAMLAGYAQSRMSKETLSLFEVMLISKVTPNEITMLSVLSACADLGALQQGMWAHVYLERNKITIDEFVVTALVDMYSKCGSIGNAKKVFESTSKRDISVWTAMITGLAMHGHGNDALEHFSAMQRSGMKPNKVTFVGVLCACSHAGLVNEGRRLFKAMSNQYGLVPDMEHYACIVDLLGRAGLLQEAKEFIEGMPLEPDRFVWGALLGGCQVHGNVELAVDVGKRLIELDPSNSGAYVLQSNMYCSAGRWEDAVRVRKMMKSSGVKKPPGCTFIEMGGLVHEFIVGDKTHPQTKEIYLMLDEIGRRLERVGYKPNTSKVLLDLDEEEKENALSRHSEKLAIAFGLINTSAGQTIRMVKNLRVCSDCHHVSKLVSKIFGREIIVRDRTRFHHFRDGSCSCNDYW
ncbi:unnamed protein product [Victoria cruziana]